MYVPSVAQVPGCAVSRFNGSRDPNSLPTVPNVVVVVGLVCFDDLWGYAVEPLMPDRPKVRFQTKRDTGVYAVRGWSRYASGTRLLIRSACASEPAWQRRDSVTPEQDPTSLKKAKVTKIPWTWHHGQLKDRAGFLVSRSLTLFSAHVQHTVGVGIKKSRAGRI